MAGSLGGRFVEALAAKDHAQLASLLHPEVDFRAMTPGRFWEASTATQVVDEVLRCWFEDSDQIDEVLEVDTTRVADRERLGYRLVVSNPDGRFLLTVDPKVGASLTAAMVTSTTTTLESTEPSFALKENESTPLMLAFEV